MAQQQQPLSNQLFNQDAQRAQPELEAAVLRFWDVVRKTADSVVTLRQENAKLRAIPQQSKTAELELLDKLAEASTEYERFRDSTAELRSSFDQLRAENLDVQGQYDVLQSQHSEVLAQLHTLQAEHETLMNKYQQTRSDLETRATDAEALRSELESVNNRYVAVADQLEVLSASSASNEESSFDPDVRTEELLATIADLESRLQRYRAAGLAYVEDPALDGQMSLFSPPKRSDNGALESRNSSGKSGLTPEELRTLAMRLDAVADRIGGLFGIS